MAKVHAALVRQVRRYTTIPFQTAVAIISGGECTVRLWRIQWPWRRCTEISLFPWESELDGTGISAIACDTDGIDGSENNAGQLSADSVQRARQTGINPRKLLDRNDAYGFFAAPG